MLTRISGAFCFSTAPVLVLAGILFWTRAGEALSPSELYTILTVVSIGMEPLDTVLWALPALSSATASFPRIQNYLCRDEQVDGRSTNATHICTKATNISANSEAAARIFSDLSIELEPGKVTMLCGPVGCGKTALLKALLGEMPLQAGFIEAPLTPIGYADQVAWLRNVSIRENICQEGFDFDENWYRQVLIACALDQDIASLPEGDQTAVGSSAGNISGGQKQRIVRAYFAPLGAFFVLTFPLYRHSPVRFTLAHLSLSLMTLSVPSIRPLHQLYWSACLPKMALLEPPKPL